MPRVFRAHRSPVRHRLLQLASLTAASLIMAGLAYHQHLEPAVVAPALILVSGVLLIATVIVFVSTRYRIEIGEDGIRISGPRSIRVGRPQKLHWGQYESQVDVALASPYAVGRVKVPQKNLWVAVEGEHGRVVFRADRGMLHRPVYWPPGRPPETAYVFYGDVIGLREAIGEAIR